MARYKKMDILYIAMILTIVGQMTVGHNFYIGQGLFLIANLIYLGRDFYLKRPKADKIKNVAFTAITLGCIIVEILL